MQGKACVSSICSTSGGSGKCKLEESHPLGHDPRWICCHEKLRPKMFRRTYVSSPAQPWPAQF